MEGLKNKHERIDRIISYIYTDEMCRMSRYDGEEEEGKGGGTRGNVVVKMVILSLRKILTSQSFAYSRMM